MITRPYRSVLYIPASNARAMEKARTLSADAIIFDLEDAVTPAEKLPARDLLVSPQHRILVRSHIAQRMFGSHEVLIAAKQLLAINGIEQVAADTVTYFHILFDAHEIVLSNGAETESLYTGAQALKAVGPAARAEILALFPELRDTPAEAARCLVPGGRAQQLARRHARNGKDLIQAI